MVTQVTIPGQLAPPARFLHNAQLSIQRSLSLCTLRHERAVFVRFAIAPYFEDDKYEEGRSIPEAVHPSKVAVDFKRAYVPDKGAGGGVDDFYEKQGYGKEEFGRTISEKADNTIEQASISGFVVVDGMSEREAYCAPSKESEKPGDLKP